MATQIPGNDDQRELERTLSLGGALAIGVGTMVGAGIFVFPGLAAGRAGVAAAASFGIGAVIALLVALPTSELATAMPKSGGGYYFISRGFGAPAGALIGIGVWTGLIFAAAFYLVGFGSYALSTLSELGIGVSVGPEVMAVVVGVFLTALSITGTEKTGDLQSGVVTVLLMILSIFLGYALLDSFGVFGRATVPEEFAPYGYPPIFETAALVFTSYLGFAQIATVAGDIKEPSTNLPRAMVGSVVVVGTLYVLTVFVTTSLTGSQELSRLGETAIVEVARGSLGKGGAVALTFAGLLATVSSANASILGASRMVYALSRDKLLPSKAGKLNRKYNTPHISLMLSGGPIVFLVATGEVELLAEVASFLHLVMYGLICFVLISLRRRNPDWYSPDYTAPAYPVLPLLGGLSSFALIAFMQPTSRLVGTAVILGAGVWYLVYGRGVRLKDET
ncbi:APC family permease [Halorutilales archaeon Cl-col2-1]